MSLTRQFLREFRPFFRMLEEPFPSTFSNQVPARGHPFFNDFTHFRESLRPAIDLTEDGNHYVVEAELPGVKRENVEVSVGNEGRSLTIEGRVFSRTFAPEAQAVTETAATSEASSTNGSEPSTGAGAVATPKQGTSNALTAENTFTSTSSSTFTRSIWLPRAVDGSNVTAKLEDGVLTVRIPKAQEQGTVRINVE